ADPSQAGGGPQCICAALRCADWPMRTSDWSARCDAAPAPWIAGAAPDADALILSRDAPVRWIA
ncbi:MAG: hypothetical protein ACE5JI_11615, partial [Acidobacteriota bacterium]